MVQTLTGVWTSKAANDGRSIAASGKCVLEYYDEPE